METNNKTKKKSTSVNYKKKFLEAKNENNRLIKEKELLVRDNIDISFNYFQIEFIKDSIMKDFIEIKENINNGYLDEKLSSEDEIYIEHYKKKIKLITSIQNKLNFNN